MVADCHQLREKILLVPARNRHTHPAALLREEPEVHLRLRLGGEVLHRGRTALREPRTATGELYDVHPRHIRVEPGVVG